MGREERDRERDRDRGRDRERDRDRVRDERKRSSRSRSPRRDRDRDRDRDSPRRERDRGRDRRQDIGERDRDRRRSRSRSREQERKRDKRNKEPEFIPPIPFVQTVEVDLHAEPTEEEMEMMRMMGMPVDFNTTQGKHVEDESANTGGIKTETKRSARQYMNRKAGFNRPLPKEVSGRRVVRD